MTPRLQARAVALLGVAMLVLSACGTTSQDEPALGAARAFLAAASAGDGAEACGVLATAARDELESSSGKPCRSAVLEEGLGSGDGTATVDVFDSMAQVELGDEVVFLSRFDGVWRVVGAACRPVPDSPYDCSIGLP